MYDSDGLEGGPNRLRPLRGKRPPLPNHKNSASDLKTTLKRDKKLRAKQLFDDQQPLLDDDYDDDDLKANAGDGLTRRSKRPKKQQQNKDYDEDGGVD